MSKTWIETSNGVDIPGVKNLRTGAYVNDATGTATLYDSAGATVAGATGLTITYSGTDGLYYCEIPHTVVLVEGATYKLRCTMTSGEKQTTIQKVFTAGYYDPELVYAR